MGPEIFRGVDVLLSAYTGLDERDAVVVVYAVDSREPAAWIAAGVKARGVEPRLVAMRPLVDDGFEERLRAVLPAKADIAGRLVVFTLERETMSHFVPLTTVLEEYGDECKIIRIISASEEFFTEGMNLSPDELSQRNATLLDRLNGKKCDPYQGRRRDRPGGRARLVTLRLDQQSRPLEERAFHHSPGR